MLEVDGLSKRFGGLSALSDVSFSMGAGEILSLIGPNGAGKTTCLNLITGFYKPSVGEVRYGDGNITGLAPHAIAQRGLIRTFQKTNVLRGLTVFGNVLTSKYRQGETSLWRTFFTSGTRAGASAARRGGRLDRDRRARRAYERRGGVALLRRTAPAWKWRSRWVRGRACSCWTSRLPA